MMFGRTLQDDMDEQDLVRAIKLRGINGTEGPADVARINAGSQWLSGGTSAAVQGANIQQGAVTAQEKNRASMDQLQATAESAQQLAAGQDAAANYRTDKTESGATTRTGMTNATTLANTGLQNAGTIAHQGLVNTGQMDVTRTQGATARDVANTGAQAQIGSAMMGREASKYGADAGVRRADIAAKATTEKARMESEARVKVGDFTKDATIGARMMDFLRADITAVDSDLLMDPAQKTIVRKQIYERMPEYFRLAGGNGAPPVQGAGGAPRLGSKDPGGLY